MSHLTDATLDAVGHTLLDVVAVEIVRRPAFRDVVGRDGGSGSS